MPSWRQRSASQSKRTRQPFVGVHVSWQRSSVPRPDSACHIRHTSKTLRFDARCRTWPTSIASVSDGARERAQRSAEDACSRRSEESRRWRTGVQGDGDWLSWAHAQLSRIAPAELRLPLPVGLRRTQVGGRDRKQRRPQQVCANTAAGGLSPTSRWHPTTLYARWITS